MFTIYVSIERPPSNHPELISPSPSPTPEYSVEWLAREYEYEPKEDEEWPQSVVPQSVPDDFDAIFAWQEDSDADAVQGGEEGWDPRIALGPAQDDPPIQQEPPVQQDIEYLLPHLPYHVFYDVGNKRKFSSISKCTPVPFLSFSTTETSRLREEGVEVTEAIQSDVEWVCTASFLFLLIL